jgi:hypothetical protein
MLACEAMGLSSAIHRELTTDPKIKGGTAFAGRGGERR